jgi:hypothetical protein
MILQGVEYYLPLPKLHANTMKVEYWDVLGVWGGGADPDPEGSSGALDLDLDL